MANVKCIIDERWKDWRESYALLWHKDTIVSSIHRWSTLELLMSAAAWNLSLHFARKISTSPINARIAGTSWATGSPRGTSMARISHGTWVWWTELINKETMWCKHGRYELNILLRYCCRDGPQIVSGMGTYGASKNIQDQQQFPIWRRHTISALILLLTDEGS